MTEIIMFLLVCSLAASAENVPTPITLWTSGSGFPCYRQPVIVAAASPSSRLLAFVEGRFSSPCGPAAAAEVQQPREVGGLNLRVSEDGGASWGSNKVIFGKAVKLSYIGPEHEKARQAPIEATLNLSLRRAPSLLSVNSVHVNAVHNLESNHLADIQIKPNICTIYTIYTIKIGMRAVLSARDVHAFTRNT